MNIPLDLLTIDSGGGCEVIDEFCTYDAYDSASAHEKAESEEITVISGTLKIAP